MIDYRPLRKELRSVGAWLRPAARGKVQTAFDTWDRERRVRRNIFDMATVAPGSAFRENSVVRLAQEYEVLVCGSDELWNFGSYLGYLPSYILDFPVARGVRKISYAASLGSYEPIGDIADRMRSSLGSFSTVLVRDQSTLEMGQHWLGPKPKEPELSQQASF